MLGAAAGQLGAAALQRKLARRAADKDPQEGAEQSAAHYKAAKAQHVYKIDGHDVLVFLPQELPPGGDADVFVFFHGLGGDYASEQVQTRPHDNAAKDAHLAEAIAASGKIGIAPTAGPNASWGSVLKHGFKPIVEQTLLALSKSLGREPPLRARSVSLAGHSAGGTALGQAALDMDDAVKDVSLQDAGYGKFADDNGVLHAAQNYLNSWKNLRKWFLQGKPHKTLRVITRARKGSGESDASTRFVLEDPALGFNQAALQAYIDHVLKQPLKVTPGGGSGEVREGGMILESELRVTQADGSPQGTIYVLSMDPKKAGHYDVRNRSMAAIVSGGPQGGQEPKGEDFGLTPGGAPVAHHEQAPPPLPGVAAPGQGQAALSPPAAPPAAEPAHPRHHHGHRPHRPHHEVHAAHGQGPEALLQGAAQVIGAIYPEISWLLDPLIPDHHQEGQEAHPHEAAADSLVAAAEREAASAAAPAQAQTPRASAAGGGAKKTHGADDLVATYGTVQEAAKQQTDIEVTYLDGLVMKEKRKGNKTKLVKTDQEKPQEELDKEAMKTRRIPVHSKAAPLFREIFAEIKESGDWRHILELPWAYTPRENRNNSTEWSIHSWGTAMDVNPETNPNGRDGATAHQEHVAKHFTSRGFLWLEHTDAMHFQYHTGGAPKISDDEIAQIKAGQHSGTTTRALMADLKNNLTKAKARLEKVKSEAKKAGIQRRIDRIEAMLKLLGG